MSKTYTIKPDLIASPLSNLFKNLPPKSLEIEITEARAAGDDQLVSMLSGKAQQHWPVIGMNAFLENVVIRLNEITSPVGKKQIEIIDVRGTIQINTKKVAFTGREITPGTLLFETKANMTKDQFPDLGKLLTVPDSPLLDQLKIFDLKENFSYSFLLNGWTDLATTHTWTVALGGFSIKGIKPKIASDSLRFNIQYQGNTKEALSNPVLGYRIDATIVLDKEYNIFLTTNASGNYELGFSPAHNSAFPGLDDIAKYIGLDDISESLHAFYKQASFLSRFELLTISSGGTLDPFKMERFSLLGSMKIGQITFRTLIAYNLGQVSLVAQLEPTETIPLGTIINKALNTANAVPANLEIAHLMIDAGFNPLEFGFQLVVRNAWEFHLGPDVFKLDQLEADFQKTKDQGIFCHLGAVFMLDRVAMQIVAEKNPDDDEKGWFFQTEITQNTYIQLKDLIAALGKIFHFEVPEHVPDVRLDETDISFHTGTHEFNLTSEIELNSPIGPIKKGDIKIAIKLTKDPASGRHKFQMNLDGTMAIAEIDLKLDAHNIGRPDWEFTLSLDKEDNKKLDVVKVAQHFNNDFKPENHKDFPDDLLKNLVVDNAHLHYQHGTPKTGKQDAVPSAFNVSIEVGEKAKLGLLLAGNEVVKANGGETHWKFLFGGFYEDAKAIPSIKIPIELKEAWLLFNTADEAGGSWPPMPKEFPHSLSDHTLKQGIMTAATIDITQKHKNIPALKNMKSNVSQTELTLLAEITTKPKGVLLEAILDGLVSIPTSRGHHLDIKDVTLKFQAPEPVQLSLSGEIDVTVDLHPVVATDILSVTPEGISDSLKVDFKQGGWQLFGLKDVFLDEFDLELGIDFEPPGVRLGLMGKVHIGKDEDNKDDFGIVMEFVGPIPNPEYLAVDITQIKLGPLLSVFKGNSAHGHAKVKDQFKNNKGAFEIDDVSLVWAEKPITLPDGKVAQPGFGFHGLIRFYTFAAYLALDVHPQTGISGTGEMSPVQIGPLRLTGSGKGITRKERWNGKNWVPVSNIDLKEGKSTKPALKDDPAVGAIREFQLMAPGGPLIHFNSSGSPYLVIGVALRFFDIKIAELDINVGDKKLHFFFFLKIGPIASFKLSCDIIKDDHPNFKVDGDFFVGFHIKFDIPLIFITIHVDIQLGITAHLMVKENTTDGFELAVSGGLNFFGKKIELGGLDFKVPPSSLKNLGKWILDYILTGKVPHFKQKIHDGSGANDDDKYSHQKWLQATAMLTRAREWAAYVHKDIQQLQKEGFMSDEEIKSIIDSINKQTDDLKKENGDKDVNANAQAEYDRLGRLTKTANSMVDDKRTKEGIEWRTKEIARMDREITDITDADQKLQKAIKAIWIKNEPELRSLLNNLRQVQEAAAEAGKDDNSKEVKAAQDAFDKVYNGIGTEVDKLGVKYDVAKGYPTSGFAKLAVDHYKHVAEQHWQANEIATRLVVTAHQQSKAILDSAHNESLLASIQKV